MSLCQIAGKLIADNPRILERLSYVTINGKLVVEDSVDHMKLIKLARTYSDVVRRMLNMVWRGYSHTEVTKLLYDMLPNYVYLETAYKNAKAIAENINFYEEYSGKNMILANIHRFWLASRGNKYDKGNRNIKLIPRENYFEVLIKYPWDSSWIKAKAFFGNKFIPLLRELIELVNKRSEGYGAVISFREYPRIHVQVPLQLYLKHFGQSKAKGYGLIAGFDINSDRLNIIVLNNDGDIVAKKTFRYSEVVSHGYPSNRAKQLRLMALAEALKWCRGIGVDYIVFEDLFKVKSRRFTSNSYTNRKIAKFAKKQILIHGIIKALKLGFTSIIVNPSGTSTSKTHQQIMREKGLDRHMASAYIIAYRGLKMIRSNEKHENFARYFISE